MQILVKVKGHRKDRAQIHVYNPETNSALCRPWPEPGDEWEVQEKASFQAVDYSYRCWHCETALKRLKQPAKPRVTPELERRQTKDLRALAAWNDTVE